MNNNFMHFCTHTVINQSAKRAEIQDFLLRHRVPGVPSLILGQQSWLKIYSSKRVLHHPVPERQCSSRPTCFNVAVWAYMII